MSRLYCFIPLLFLFISGPANCSDEVVNVYAWPDVISASLIRQFENETGIKVNFSTFSSNEVMYAKLRATPRPRYDVIEPSSYYINRLRQQHMLETLNRKDLSHFKNLDPDFLNKAYDPHNRYSVPYIWGITGIFYNEKKAGPEKWADLWDPKWHNQLMLLNDAREVFSMALLTLGYSVNDSNPRHIEKAFEKLKTLLPNVRLFKSDGVISLLADEDVNAGMAWNGDAVRASLTNPHLSFVFPKDGFVIAVDSFAIPKDPPHKKNALRFIDFMLRADIAAKASLKNGFPIANRAGRKLLPPSLRNNKTEYPSRAVLKRGQFQQDISDEALALYELYWEKLKMGDS